jgi:hypothetical protein
LHHPRLASAFRPQNGAEEKRVQLDDSVAC